MANVDGSIRINVELEEQGYKRTLKALHHAVSATTKDMEKLLRNVGNGMSLDKGITELKRIEVEMMKITNQASLLKARFKGLDSIKLTLGAENIYRSLSKARDFVNGFYNAVEAHGVEIPLDEEEFERALAEAQESYNTFLDDLSGRSLDLSANNETIDVGFLDTGDIDTSSLDNLSGKIGSMKSGFESLALVFKPTVEYIKLAYKTGDMFFKDISKAVNTVKKLASEFKVVASGVLDASKFFLDFSHDALEALGITRQLNESLSGIGFGDLVGADLLSDAIRELATVLKEFTVDTLDSGKAFQSYYMRIKDTFGDSKEEIFNFAKTSTEYLGMSETAYMEAASKIGVFARSYIKDTDSLTDVTVALANGIADLAAQTGFSVDDTMQKVLSGLRGNTEAIEELGINVKVTDMQTWLDRNGINEKFENLNSEMQNLYRTWYMLDTLATNGTMGYATKMAGTFAGQLNILKARFEDLKTTVGTYLMQALVPVLSIANMLLSRLVDIANMVGKAFGLLNRYDLAESIGNVDSSDMVSIYDDAKNAISGAVSEQDKLSESTKKASAEAKKALAPFHKLNILSNNSSKSGSSASPSVGSSGIGSAIKTTPSLNVGGIEKEVNLWLEAFKKAIKDGKWYEAGELLGKKINEVVDKIDFTKYRDKIYKGVENLANFINGAIAEIDFSNIGVKLGEGVNTIVVALNKLLDGIDFKNIGKSLSELSRGLLTTISWDEVGRLWTQKTKNLISILDGFVEDMSRVDLNTGNSGWVELGNSMFEFVYSAISSIEWGTLGKALGDGVYGLFTSVSKFFEDWQVVDDETMMSKLETVVNSVVSGINNFIRSVSKDFSVGSILSGNDVQENATSANYVKAISGLINTIIESVGIIISSTDFGQLGVTLGNAIFGSIASIDVNKAGKLIISAIDSVLSFAMGAVASLQVNYDKIKELVTSIFDKIVDYLSDETNRDNIVNTINSVINAAFDLLYNQDWSGLTEAVGKILEGIDWNKLMGILKFGDIFTGALKLIVGDQILSDAIDGVIGWVFETLLSAAINSNPFGLLVSVGSNLIEGLINGITSWEVELPNKLTDIIMLVIDTFKSLFKINSPSKVFEEIGVFLIQGLFNGINETWGTIIELFNSSVSILISNVTGWFNNLKTGVIDIFTSMSSSVSSTWGSLKDSVELIVTNMHSALSSTVSNIGSSIGLAFDNMKQTVLNVFTSMKDGVAGVLSSLSLSFDSVKQNVLNTFTSMKDGIVGVLSSLKDSVKEPINSVLGLAEGLANGVTNGINGVIGSLNGLNVDIPEVGGYGGKKFSFNIPSLKGVKIPRLANGTVIKPNQRFIAELGDQTKGINIETPLETMLDAFEGALASGGYGSGGDITIPVYIGGELIDEVIVDANNRDTYRNNGR